MRRAGRFDRAVRPLQGLPLSKSQVQPAVGPLGNLGARFTRRCWPHYKPSTCAYCHNMYYRRCTSASFDGVELAHAEAPATQRRMDSRLTPSCPATTTEAAVTFWYSPRCSLTRRLGRFTRVGPLCSRHRQGLRLTYARVASKRWGS